jgi:hypothetical protein
MTNEQTIDMSKLHALLPAYLNGTAGAADRTFVKNALSQSAEARAALAWHESLAEKVINDVESMPADIGWAQLQAKVRASTSVRYDQSNAQKTGRYFWRQRVWSAVEPYLPHKLLSAPALGAVCVALVAVVIGQGLLLGSLGQEPEYATERGLRQENGTQGAALNPTELVVSQLPHSKFVRLNFKEQVSERDMRLLLIRTGAVIVGGPGQLGDYTIAIPASELEQALKQYKESLLTESALEVASPTAQAGGASGTTGVAPGQASPRNTP